MAYDWSSILTAQAERIDSEQAEAAAQLEAARHREDASDVMHYSNRILDLDLQRNALAARANNFVAAQQAQPRGNAYGLSNEEIEIAKASHSGGTVQERIEEYARNKQKLQYMRATGEYRDDQGRVTR